MTYETCGLTREAMADDPCRRSKNHQGKHRGRRGTWPRAASEKAAVRRPRYVPPHYRAEGEPDRSFRGYRHP